MHYYNKGIIRNLFESYVGSYWRNATTGLITVVLYDVVRYEGFSDETLTRWLDNQELYAEEGYTKASWIAEGEKEEA